MSSQVAQGLNVAAPSSWNIGSFHPDNRIYTQPANNVSVCYLKIINVLT